ncbi:MauE/DoxX family redox-associated membrane protein [Thermodesulfobacteriota bacterium]
MEIQKLIMSNWAYRVIRWFLVLVFMYAGMSKLFDPQSLAVVIESYDLVPESGIMPITFILPALEVLAAVGLLFDVRGSLTAISGLLFLFMIILTYGIWMGLDVDCGCFGPDDPEAEAFSGLRTALYRDMVMLAGIFYLYFLRFKKSFQPVGMVSIFKTRLK